MRDAFRVGLLMGLGFGLWSGAPCLANAGGKGIRVDFFYELGCDECAQIRRDVLPGLERDYAGYVSLYEWDIGITSNYLHLVAFQDRLAVKDNAPVSLVVDGQEYLSGVAGITTNLFPAVERALARHDSGQRAPVAPDGGRGAAGLLERRVEAFTLAGIVGAAVVDSINPCAISVLVFFMSLLSVARMGAPRMALAGLAFMVGSYVTYLAIGFGLLRLLQFMTAVRLLRLGVEWGLMAVMAGFAFLSFCDAFRYHRSGRSDDVSLKLPAPVQALIHRVMRLGLRRRNLVLAGLGIGAGVTVLESVCTGQVYVPALVMMIKGGQSSGRWVLYLVLYNAIFILPLAVVLRLTCAGIRTPVLVEWSRRNVLISKVLLGLFFVGMTILLVVMR